MIKLYFDNKYKLKVLKTYLKESMQFVLGKVTGSRHLKVTENYKEMFFK